MNHPRRRTVIAGYFFSFNQECHQTSACDIVPAFRQQLLEGFFLD
jgi:hypothetical protein